MDTKFVNQIPAAWILRRYFLVLLIGEPVALCPIARSQEAVMPLFAFDGSAVNRPDRPGSRATPVPVRAHQRRATAASRRAPIIACCRTNTAPGSSRTNTPKPTLLCRATSASEWRQFSASAKQRSAPKCLACHALDVPATATRPHLRPERRGSLRKLPWSRRRVARPAHRARLDA